MRGLISLPLYIPGTPYARAVQVLNKSNVLIALFIKLNENNNNYERLSFSSIYLSPVFLFIVFGCKKEACYHLLYLWLSLQARIRISSTVKAIIEKRRARRRRNNDNDDDDDDNINNSKKNSDFLEILLSVDTLSEDEKVSFVLDSLLGGYETTSLLMCMVVRFLSHSPAALQRLKVTPPL